MSIKDRVQIIFVVPSFFYNYMGVELLSSCLKRNGFYNISAVSLDSRKINKIIKKSKFNIIAFYTITPFCDQYIKLSRYLKKRYRNIMCIFGGPHPTFCPEMIEEEGVDGLCRGEGEEAIVEFVNNYCQDQRLPIHIRNWWFRQNNKIYRNELRPLIHNLDELPFADKSIFAENILFKKGYRTFIFSRGCCYGCNFCSMPYFVKLYNTDARNYYRVRSVESAIQQIKNTLGEYGGSLLRMNDSIFGINLDWLDKFNFYYKKEINLPFHCNSEAQLVTEKYVDLLKEAGCCYIFLGLETANSHMRNEKLNKKFDNETFLRAINLIKERRIKIGVTNMIGIPGMTLQDDIDTVRMNQIIKPDVTNSFFYSFLAGSEISTRIKKEGIIPKLYKTIMTLNAPAITHHKIRNDLPKLSRLHYLFEFFVYLNVPLFIVKIMISLPLRFIYSTFASIFMQRIRRNKLF